MGKLIQAYVDKWEAEARADEKIRTEKLKLVGETAIEYTASTAGRNGRITHIDFNRTWDMTIPIPGLEQFGNEVFGNKKELPLAEFRQRSGAILDKKITAMNEAFQPDYESYVKARRKLAARADGVIDDLVKGGFSAAPAEKPMSFKELMGGGNAAETGPTNRQAAPSEEPPQRQGRMVTGSPQQRFTAADIDNNGKLSVNEERNFFYPPNNPALSQVRMRNADPNGLVNQDKGELPTMAEMSQYFGVPATKLQEPRRKNETTRLPDDGR